MLKTVKIRNFKSIKELEFSAKRVNVFIGEPNSGKSNLLEALGVFCGGIYENQDDFREVLRFKTAADLFFDRELTEQVRVVTDGLEWVLKFDSSQMQGTFLASNRDGITFTLGHGGQLGITRFPESPVRYYRFKTLTHFGNPRPGPLQAPFGSNLVALLTTNKRLASMVDDLFLSKGFHMVIDHERSELSLAKVVDRRFFNYSYPTISETLRRIVFFMAALESNKDATLLLDEPEANTFPFYTKYLAERIALDETNQFFITTHNPYLLSSVVEKTPLKDLTVFVTRMEKFETKVKQIPDKKLSELLELDSDAFFNLDKLVEE